MAYRINPFLERMSERKTSDQEFVRLFSPNVLEHLAEDAFLGGVHIFRSPPGGGKTTLLRAFTPPALRAFLNARRVEGMSDTCERLLASGVLDEQEGPQLLGVLLSCASGYADLPPGASAAQEGLFRALLDCRIVLRALRSVVSLLGFSSIEQAVELQLSYDASGSDLKSIPLLSSPLDLVRWAEDHERAVYASLDGMRDAHSEMPSHVRFEGVLWFQSVRFIVGAKEVAPRRLLMIDDLHKLRRKQRALLFEEHIETRPRIPVWLADRTIALGEELLSQGSREGRDVREYMLEDMWSPHKFISFAQNVLDRRLHAQSEIPVGAFAQYLRDDFSPDEVRECVRAGVGAFRRHAERYRALSRYDEWLARAERDITQASMEGLRSLYVTRILLARDELKRQLSLSLDPLPAAELEERESSAVQGAAEIFMHEDLKVAHYYGIHRLCTLASSNVEELLTLAAALYDGLRAKQVLRPAELVLSPQEQEKLLREAAKRKRDFIPKAHTEGTRAQRLLDAVGSFCRDRTFVVNAPIAPGVTGFRISQRESAVLNSAALATRTSTLKRVLAESVAENLLMPRASAASSSRESGIVFYLNRTLCAHYGLPLQMGGWQDVAATDLIDWMERGRGVNQLGLREVR
jgi:hypothetical protein